MKPTLLGAGTGSATVLGAGKGSETSSSSDNLIQEVSVRKHENLPLDISIEGGLGSPLGDKIVVADVYPGGAVDQEGEIHKGDQLLEVNGRSLSGMQLSEAEELLWEAEQNCPLGASIKFLISKSEMSYDEVTYF